MRFLVVGNNEDIAGHTTTTLDRQGIEWDRVQTFAEMMAADLTSYSAVMTQLGLDDGNGIEVFMMARVRSPGMPVLITDCDNIDLPGGVQIRENRVSLLSEAFEPGGAAERVIEYLEENREHPRRIAAQMGISLEELEKDEASICKKAGVGSMGAAMARVLFRELPDEESEA